MKTPLLVILLASALLAQGCATSLSGGAYSRTQARQVQEVQMGVVESVRQVAIEGTNTGVGTVSGAAVGGVAGSTIGEGKGATIATILGAVGGAVAGHAIEESATRKPGLEITVKLDSGRMLAITQEADESFKPGDRVRVLTGGGATRVTH